MRSVLVYLSFSVCFCSFGQVTPIEWENSFGGSQLEEVGSIQQTSDGGYILAGETSSSDYDVSSNNGLHDFWLIKIDGNGLLSWEKSFGGSQMEKAHCVKQTFDGGYIIAGESSSLDGDVTHNNGDRDFWIVKVTALGNIEWQKSYGGSGWDSAKSIQPTQDGGFIVAGESESSDGDVSGSHGDMDFWILKLDGSGNLTWQKSFGGSNWDSAESIQETNDGGFIVAGASESGNGDVTFNQGEKDFWIVKLDANGLIEWEQSYGGSEWDSAHSIQQTTDGGYVIAGESKSSNGHVGILGSNLEKHGGDRDVWAIKVDSMGNLEWESLLGGTDWDAGRSVQQTADNGYVVLGYSNSYDDDVTENKGNWDYWVVKLNSVGSLEWEKSLGGSYHDIGTSIQITNDGGYIVAGNAWSNDIDVSLNQGANDIWVVKLSPYLATDEYYIPKDKKPIKIFNYLGQETVYEPNTPLIVLYSDGTRERVMRLEK
ncbi:MAG: T9SS C-terminal target domain-containing protein [Fluviicola sp.]